MNDCELDSHEQSWKKFWFEMHTSNTSLKSRRTVDAPEIGKYWLMVIVDGNTRDTY